MTYLLAIDPGPVRSAAVWMDGETILEAGIWENNELMRRAQYSPAHLAIEMIASYGMPVGRETFETCVWIGRFVERLAMPFTFVYRKDVKMCLCGTMKAKDGNIRQALIDRLGPVGTKATPGPCYGISKDMWSALAVAITYREAFETADAGKSNGNQR